jgi:Putative zinc- or iron-chelating domain
MRFSIPSFRELDLTDTLFPERFVLQSTTLTILPVFSRRFLELEELKELVRLVRWHRIQISTTDDLPPGRVWLSPPQCPADVGKLSRDFATGGQVVNIFTEDVLSLPERAKAGLPCLWLDEKTGRCRHYEFRPEACREAVQPGDESCLAFRAASGRPVNATPDRAPLPLRPLPGRSRARTVCTGRSARRSDG